MRLSHHQPRNRVDPQMIVGLLDLAHVKDLRAAVDDLLGDGVRSMVITGASSSFCSGAGLGVVYGPARKAGTGLPGAVTNGDRLPAVNERFSVIIPTLQMSSRLDCLVEMYCAHDLVGEVLIINNSPVPWANRHSKTRVLQQSENLFVNPAWNLGARQAREDLLIISNDDITFAPEVIDLAWNALQRRVGIIGPHADVFNTHGDRSPRLSRGYLRTSGFGTLMFLRKASYVPIPDDLLIWAGDNWLFNHQEHQNLYLRGICIDTEMGTTSRRQEFDEQKRRDRRVYFERYHTDHYARRHWLGHSIQSAPRWVYKRVDRSTWLPRGARRRVERWARGEAPLFRRSA